MTSRHARRRAQVSPGTAPNTINEWNAAATSVVVASMSRSEDCPLAPRLQRTHCAEGQGDAPGTIQKTVYTVPIPGDAPAPGVADGVKAEANRRGPSRGRPATCRNARASSSVRLAGGGKGEGDARRVRSSSTPMSGPSARLDRRDGRHDAHLTVAASRRRAPGRAESARAARRVSCRRGRARPRTDRSASSAFSRVSTPPRYRM